jgi:hypothetical protein
MCLIVDVVVYRLTANCHPWKKLFQAPTGLGDWISFSFDQVLIRSSSFPVFQICFHVVDFFSIEDVRNWSREVFSMHFCFDIGFEKHSMENVMNLPCSWQFQSICNRSQD